MTMQNPQTCLSAELLRQLSHDELSPAELKDVEDHVSDCERCRQLLEVPQSDSQWQDEIVPILRTPLESPHVAGDHDERGCEGESLESILRLLGPTDDPHMLGRIGSYEVVGVIGRGGMGVVFKAYEGALNRFVAIKMLLPHLAASGAARKRFAREGKAAAAVIDDNVMPIYSVAEWQGVPYLVTQYSRGATLEKRIRDQGPLELKEILRIGMQTARGLAAAHAQGLVHRDVKPSNILLDGTVERALLTDFGLARAVDDASITKTGIIAGTPQYMSPEQARGGSVDARSDLFGLGCVLYAMCTGRPPFRADNSYAILRMITDDDPRTIREINPDIPEWFCQLISRLMAKSPDARFGNALEVAALLEQCLAHVQQPTSVPLPASLVPHSMGNAMKSSEPIECEPRIPWYWAVALLIPIGVVVVGSTFALLLLYYGGSQPLPPEARIPVTMAFPISAIASFFLWRWALQSLLMRLTQGHQPTSIPLSASLVTHAAGRRSIFNITRKGVIAMLGTLGMTLLGLVLLQATEAPDISGQWISDEWGTVVLEAKGSGKYEGTFSGAAKGQPAFGLGGAAGHNSSSTTPEGANGVMFGSTGPRPGMGTDNGQSAKGSAKNAEPGFAFGQRQRVLNVSQVMKEGRALNESEEVVVVRFQVADARIEKFTTEKDQTENWWVLSSEKAPYESHPLSFRVIVRTKVLDELKKNGIEDIAKHFVGKVLEVEGSVQMAIPGSVSPLMEKRWFQLDIPSDHIEYPCYSTTVYNLQQIQEAKGVSPPMIDGAKTLNRENIRSVIEVYVAAALQGDHTTAASVAIVQGKLADPKQIEPQIQAISRSLNLKQLAMHSIYLNDWEHPTGALAISESVTHAEKQRNGERAGFVMLELVRSEKSWFVAGVEFRTKEVADDHLKRFLTANPKSIDLPPLTPNSLPPRNPVEEPGLNPGFGTSKGQSAKGDGRLPSTAKGQPALGLGGAAGHDSSSTTPEGASGVMPGTSLGKGKSGMLHLKWSRVERRFNGTWGKGADRSGTMSLRLVDKEIRGGFTTDEEVQLKTGTPLVGDLLWKRSAVTVPDGGTVLLGGLQTVDETFPSPLKIPLGDIRVEVYAGRGLWYSKDKEVFKLLDSVKSFRGATVRVHEDSKGDAFTKAVVHDPAPVRAEPAENQKREERIRTIKIAIDEALRAHKVPNVRWLDANGNQQNGPVPTGLEQPPTPANMAEPPVAFGQLQRSLNVSQVLKEGRALNESREVVVVRFRVADARTESVRTDKDETWWVLSSEKAPYDNHPLSFRASITTKALDELKKNGVEDIAKHFVGKILDVEGPVQVTESSWSDIPGDPRMYPFYSTNVYKLDRIQEAKAVSLPTIDGAKTLDRKNIRSVIEAYVAAALQGDHTTAASVAIVEGKPADPKQIEQQIQAISHSLKLKQLAMHSIHLNDCEHPTGALAISKSVNHAEKQRNGERTGFVMLELFKSEESWFVTGVEFRTKEVADDHLKRFLTANPKSIDLPPLTPNSLPPRNPVDADQQSNRSAAKTTEIDKPLDRKNARSVVEAWVAAVIAKDVKKASSLAKDWPARANQIEGWGRHSKLEDFVIGTVKTDEQSSPLFALVVSSEKVQARLPVKDQPAAIFLAFKLKLVDDAWFIIDVEPWGTVEQAVDHFLNQDADVLKRKGLLPLNPEDPPKSIDVSPQTYETKVPGTENISIPTPFNPNTATPAATEK